MLGMVFKFEILGIVIGGKTEQYEQIVFLFLHCSSDGSHLLLFA